MTATTSRPIDVAFSSDVGFIHTTNRSRRTVTKGVRPSEGDTTLAIIDLEPALSGSADDIAMVVSQIRTAAKDIGFFMIKNHGVPQSIIDAALGQMNEFFTQPDGVKLAVNAIQRKEEGKYQGRGYIAPAASKQRNYSEGFFIGNEHPEAHIDYGTNLWPSVAAVPNFRPVMEAYTDHLTKLAIVMQKLFSMALGMPANHFDGVTKTNSAILRLNWYPSQTEDTQAIGIHAHTDYSAFTLLYQDEIPALQILNKEGEFRLVQPQHGCFVVNTADYLERWSNGIFESTAHRVVNFHSSQRRSIAFFWYPDRLSVVEPLPTCVTDDNPAKYDPALTYDLVKARWNVSY